MRKIEFVISVNTGKTLIKVDEIILDTKLDETAIRQYRVNRAKLPPVMGTTILSTMQMRLANDVIVLSEEEMDFITDHLKGKLGL